MVLYLRVRCVLQVALRQPAVTSDFRELRLLPSARGAYAFLVEGDTAEGTALDAGV